MTIYDMNGNVFEYNPENGLISRNNIIVSGADYEPVFTTFPDHSSPPMCVGIYFKKTGQVLCKSGKLNRLIDSRQL